MQKPAWLPSWPYPSPKEGYWMPVTSTLNWCEEDYYATEYSAEIMNSITNVLFFVLAIRGIRNCLRNDHDQIFLISFIGYGIVGIGSFLFHSTLKYPMQLVDELSMIYTACLMCYATFSFAKSALARTVWAVGLTSLAAFITLYYHYLQDPTFHQNAYAILTAIVLTRCMYVMETKLRPDKANAKIISTMWLMIACGLSIFLGGFLLWTLDNNYCDYFRRWRHEMGLPYGLLLEGHAWWHVMTGIGAYFYIVWGIWLRHCLKGNGDDYELIWPSILTSLPDVQKVKSKSMARKRGKKTQ